MIFFCEECGGKNEVAPEQPDAIRCRICNDLLRNGPCGASDRNEPTAAAGNGKIRVMIVDDSRLIRKAVRGIFDQAPHIQVVGEAENGAAAVDLVPEVNPDVITLDINMPVMDGLTALKHIMIRKPTPTLMFSTLTRDGSEAAFQALEYGAVDVMHKPSQVAGACLQTQNREIVRKVSLAADVETEAIRYIRTPERNRQDTGGLAQPCDRIIVVGAAEGGYGGLLKFVPRLRSDMAAGVVVMLYAAADHAEAFAAYLDRLSAVRVRRARHGQPIHGGECHLAADGEYPTVERHNGAPSLRVEPAPFSARRGSVNMLMFSAAELFGANAVGVVLSGRGDDGLEGMREIMRCGGSAVVQDPRTCLYKEMAWSVVTHTTGHRIATDNQMMSRISSLVDATRSTADPNHTA